MEEKIFDDVTFGEAPVKRICFNEYETFEYAMNRFNAWMSIKQPISVWIIGKHIALEEIMDNAPNNKELIKQMEDVCASILKKDKKTGVDYGTFIDAKSVSIMARRIL